MAGKLYPPTIGASIPAFYKEGTTAKIVVPFSMNRAVSANSVYSFKLKIKTAYSNTWITTLESDIAQTSNYIENRVIEFLWNNPTINIGTYIKVLLAYTTWENNAVVVGYFSTVAVAKYTAKPTIYIKDAESNSNSIPTYKFSYTGVYEIPQLDQNERPYSYCFFLYDKDSILVETSGWKLHNITTEKTVKESITTLEVSDTYNFISGIQYDEVYYVLYGVKTINGLEIYSPLYACIEPSTGVPDFDFNLVAINNFEEGYISLRLALKEDVVNTSLPNAVSIEISRAEINYSYNLIDDLMIDVDWLPLRRLYFAADSEYDALDDMELLQDFTVEQGVKYIYCFRLYNSQGVLSNKVNSNAVTADFEDMFLTDGKRHLKIRFNPKVSSFKTTQQEQKIDTIGSRFPFIFRNGVTEYKEFPISGLISYLTDNNERFLDYETELNIISPQATRRVATPVGNSDTSYEFTATLDSIGYNMAAERRFKLILLDWLNNGSIKLFRSPAEGNYLVRLMNVSLTPEDKLGRMIHSFLSTAYEVEELNYQNLLNLNLILLNESEETYLEESNILIKSRIDGDATTQGSYKLNSSSVLNYFSIEPSPSTANTSFYIRLGEDNAETKVLIRTGNFSLKSQGEMPDIYINMTDNGVNTAEELISLVGDAILRYLCRRVRILVGDFAVDNYTVDTVSIENVVGTLCGPNKLIADMQNSTLQVNVLKYYVLDFCKKYIRNLYENSSTGYYYTDNEYQNRFTAFVANELYRITSTSGTNIYKFTPESGLTLKDDNASADADLNNLSSNQIKCYILNGTETIAEYNDAPLIDLTNNYFTKIVIGADYYVNYAYLKKVINYKLE